MKLRVKYVPMPGNKISGAQAKAIAEAMNRIAAERGCVKPQDLVEEARDKRSPIHSLFTWDDTEAAEQWRITEARTIIRNVRLIHTDDAPLSKDKVIRAFHNVIAGPDDTWTQGYVPTTTIIEYKREDLAEQIIARAHDELEQWKKRHGAYREYFTGVFEAIEKLPRKKK